MQKRVKVVIGMLFAVGTALFIILAAAYIAPPRYTAHAEFSVNWNQMPPNEQNQGPQQARQEFNASLAKFRVSKEFISLLCDHCKLPSTQFASIEAQLRKYLRVIPAGTTNDCALYRIWFEDDNQAVALEAVNLLSSRFVSRLNRKSKSHYTSEALKSYEDNAKNRNNEDNLREELANLSQQQNREFSLNRQARIKQITQELNVNDIHKTFSGLRTLVNGVGIFVDPAKVEQKGEAQKR